MTNNDKGSHVRIETILLVLGLLLSGSVFADASEAEVRSHVQDYFRDFNALLPPSYLVETYLDAPLSIFSSAGIRHLASKDEVESWLGQIQDGLEDSGWLRSELLETRLCMADENLAVFSMKLARVEEEGATILGGTYTLFNTDRWRIVAIMIADPDRLLGCDSAR